MKDAFSNTDPICYISVYNMTFISDVFIFSKHSSSNSDVVLHILSFSLDCKQI